MYPYAKYGAKAGLKRNEETERKMNDPILMKNVLLVT